jgi:DNA-binding transcriptional ArsR family regulator
MSTTKESKAAAKKSSIDILAIKKASIIIRSINHKLRQQIIKLLEESEQQTVTEIYVKMRIEQSVASQHLAILRRSGVVLTNRDGKYITYSVNKVRLKEIADLINTLIA